MLFTDGTSIIFIIFNLEDFKSDIKIKFESLNKWFRTNKTLITF